jgi:predicted metal-dependent RNase
MSRLRRAPERVFVTHGEPEAAAELAAEIGLRKRWKTGIPASGDVENL